MKQQFDIAPARKKAGVTQREVEAELGFPAVAMSAIEDGRIGIDSETYDQIHQAICAIGAQKREAKECDEKALTSARS